MKKKMSTNDVKSLLEHVIERIDRWWVEKTDHKGGYFTRSKCAIPDILYQDYVEWKFSLTDDSKEYESLFISLDYENSIDYISIALKTMRNGVYTKYDPFCEIYDDGKTEVVISEQTGFIPNNIIHDVLTNQDFDVLTDVIATTVHRFVTPTDEENVFNYELHQSLPRFQDNEIKAPVGLMTKEVFVLDTRYFVIGDIYFLEIDPKYDLSKTSTKPIKVPRRVYAICEDVCSTVIHFMFGGIERHDSLLRIQVHAYEIESGLITVKRVLMNESLIQTEDEECL